MRPKGASTFGYLVLATKNNTWIAARLFSTVVDQPQREHQQPQQQPKLGHRPRRHFTRMSVEDQQVFTIPAERDHTATVIFLHGLGDNGGSWLAPFQSIRTPHIKYIFPTAPVIPVTWQNGMEMPAWFNIKSLTYHQYDEDERGIRNAVKKLHVMLNEEIKSGIPSDRIVLGGFSQGGGLALHGGLTFDQPLAALIGLSCRIPLPKRIISERRININIPLLHCHGDADSVTPTDITHKVQNTIREFNKNHTFKLYPKMVHTTCDQEMKDVKDFINKHIPEK